MLSYKDEVVKQHSCTDLSCSIVLLNFIHKTETKINKNIKSTDINMGPSEHETHHGHVSVGVDSYRSRGFKHVDMESLVSSRVDPFLTTPWIPQGSMKHHLSMQKVEPPDLFSIGDLVSE